MTGFFVLIFLVRQYINNIGEIFISYDLMVFDKTVLQTKEGFMKWYRQQIQWNDDHDYNRLSVMSRTQQKLFMETKDVFLPMKSEYVPDYDENYDHYISDYSIGRYFIYITFAWSREQEAYQKLCSLSLRYHLEFTDKVLFIKDKK